jgi:hypothetical protein
MPDIDTIELIPASCRGQKYFGLRESTRTLSHRRSRVMLKRNRNMI